MVSPFRSAKRKGVVILQGSPDFRVGRDDILESRRHYADDGVAAGSVISAACLECDRASDDVGICRKAAVPQTIADDKDIRAMNLIVLRLKVATLCRNNSKRAEVASGHPLPPEELGFADSHHRRSPHFHDGHGIE